MMPAQPQGGFTLLEILVALAIVAIALAATLRALGVSAGGAQAMQQRSLALQAAENRLAELRLLRAFPNPGRQVEPCPQGPLALVCEQEFQTTVNGNFRLATVRARLAQGPVLAELNGLLSSLP
ncbi:type II secretion system minor pseudopilin GspI [Parapusillimonas granuli]|uniref:Type II secretion system protein I n=1 Tax=Parapusillimonas granuli TaxID=380911 RepID=A0A853FX06_9BURK|nr:type II secretion system minor pseudopilin GspI [Parapusillimonas granuli]MBB5214193.1 general secretion pathway protein I [Parapusillimonas granuli]MEB2399020.1 type II secretion system minor pseudopilin GspI [Alcaligenaceae bacterium]NYT50614.1 type II secretion system minor pseudopilin GspI [Parapusillimonas granuli]